LDDTRAVNSTFTTPAVNFTHAVKVNFTHAVKVNFTHAVTVN
jgi:hypothetical protein